MKQKDTMHEWIKLNTAIAKHPISRDPYACHVFIHLLVVCDNNGRGTLGRFGMSQELGLNSSTFYKALKRCEKKHNLVTLSSNNKFTCFSILNWDKYQSVGNSSGNSAVTTRGQHKDTYINKERREEKRSVKSFSENHSVTPQLPVIPYPEGITNIRAVLKERRLIPCD
jgi:hypothetical protein